jgi:DNA-directed RNA polymerase sigma subunit (sigma70/sigma32)
MAKHEMAKIEERLKSALKHLDVTSQFIIQSIFGIFGCSSSSTQKVAKEENVSAETIAGLQADALRALMGYGPKAPSELSSEDTLSKRKSSSVKKTTVLPTGSLN